MAESTLTNTCATRNPGAPQRSSEWIHPLLTSLSHCVAALRRATIAAGACHVPVESDFIQTHRAAPGDARRRHAAGRGHRHLRARSEEHTSELQSLMRISYAVFCLKKKTNKNNNTTL